MRMTRAFAPMSTWVALRGVACCLAMGCSTAATSASSDGGRHDGAAGRDALGASSRGDTGARSSSRGRADASVDGARDGRRGTDAPGTDAKDAGRAPDASMADATDAYTADATVPFDAPPCLKADAGPSPPSCAPGGPGMTNCGACLESCCTSLEVEGGTYFRTYDLTDAGLPAPPPDGGPTGEADPASVSDFRLDKYLVTVGRFRQFVTAWDGGAGYVPPVGSGKHVQLNSGQGLANSGSPGTYEQGWSSASDTSIAPTDANLACYSGFATWTSSAATRENLPINCVTWEEAYAFCIWDGGFLPSEAEWGYAAAGGHEQRLYPWGSTPVGAGNEYAIFGCNYPDHTGICTGVANVANVGTAVRGAGRWGQLDMAGELFEWNLDWYAPYVDPCADCSYLTTTSNRVIRGAYFSYDASYLVASNRGNSPSSRVNGIGFRCARAP